MKRSEMVQEIIDTLEEHISLNAYDWKYRKNIANVILRRIEEYGMIPPCTDCKRPPTMYCEESGEEHNYKWEPEDETKKNA